MSDEILTVQEVAALLKVADKTVYTMAQRGEMPAPEPAHEPRRTECHLPLLHHVPAGVSASGPQGARQAR
ncbi:helix-turn-helix transcriptional regulator [Cystobacter fuscus]